MSRRHHQLARRGHASDALRRQVINFAGEAAAEYVVSHTMLGDFAMHWSADWYAGLFSITDLPPEWVAIVEASLNGGWHEAVYGGEPAAFSTILWELKPADDPSISCAFSEVLLDAAGLPGGPRKALPGPGQSTV